MSNIPPFYVGQRVVCVKDKYRGLVKNREYIVTGLQFVDCCKYWVVGVNNGIIVHNGQGQCVKCKKWLKKEDSYFYTVDNFAPIHEDFQAITYEKVMELESPLISVQ